MLRGRPGLSRRAVLRLVGGVAGAMVLGGCRADGGGAPHKSSVPEAGRVPSVAAGSVAASEPFSLFVDAAGPAGLPNALAAFSKQYPRLRLAKVSFPARLIYWMEMLTGQNIRLSPYTHVSLDAVLRAHNFNPSILLSTALDPFVQNGHTLALPFTSIPWAVQWNTAAFAAARLPRPAVDWAYGDFLDACAALKTLAATGGMQGLRGALAPPVVPHPAPGVGVGATGSMAMPGLWQAFAWGFGGSLASHGKLVLTDPGTLKGMAALVELSAEYAVSPAIARNAGFALAFALFRPGGLPAGWQWARLPRFPVTPVITTVTVAQGLAYRAPMAAPAPDAPLVRAAAEYLLWWYTPTATTLLQAESTPPALASAAVQEAYWQGRGGGASAVGDWTHFRDCYAGLPVTPDPILYRALQAVVFDKVALRTALAAAERDANNPLYRVPQFYLAQPDIGVTRRKPVNT